MNNIWLVAWITLIVYILLETDAIPEWGKLLRLKFLKYEEYEKQQTSLGLRYKYFLLSKHPNFIVHLITCQECLSVWLTIFGFLLFREELGGWQRFGLTALGSIKGIAAFKFILKRLYE